MNKPSPNNRKPNKTIQDLIDFIESAVKGFTNSTTFKQQYHDKSDEDHLTEILLWHYQEENRKHEEKYIFMAQPKQENRRKVDIGIGLFGGSGNYIFCIEAKILLLPQPCFDYITGKYAAIKRFKAQEHGLSSSNPNIGKPLPYNCIIAYVKLGTFKEHFIKINEKIKEIAEKHSQQADKFGLTWNASEQLEKIYFKSIAKLFSKHPRQSSSDVSLYHFWIYVHLKR